MRWLILISFFSSLSFSIDMNSCVRSNFDFDIKKPGAFWGTFKYKMQVSKNRCRVKIYRKNILESSWDIDICREPVNIKAYQFFTHKDYLKTKPCTKKSQDTFCKKKNEVISLIEKEGLVHVNGERDNFESNHGKLFCLNDLVVNYLSSKKVYSMEKNYNFVPKPSTVTYESDPGLERYKKNDNSVETNVDTPNEKLDEF